MANTSAATTHWNAAQYLGELFLIGANSRRTPFLTMAGGIDGSNSKVTGSWQFPVAQTYDLESPSQPAITETTSLTAPTAITYVRTQDTNTCQIFQRQYSVSYAAQSDMRTLSGLALADGNIEVPNEREFQRQSHMLQVAQDVDYTFLLGSYQAATDAGTAAKTRGIVSAVSTNAIDASGNDFSTAYMNMLLESMFAYGSPLVSPVIFCGAHVKTHISDEYGYAPMDRTVGGVNIKQIETDFGSFGVVLCPNLTSTTLLVADMSVVSPVFLPKDGQYIIDEPLAKTGAGDSFQIYAQIGLAYGPEEYHGKITNLASS